MKAYFIRPAETRVNLSSASDPTIIISMRRLKAVSQTALFFISIIVIANLLYAGTIILNFDGQPGYNKVVLKWTTQNEINLKGFEVERGFDQTKSETFKNIGFVKASTEVTEKKEYSYEDKSVFKQLERTYYYRLKIVDTNESFSYYDKVIAVTPTISSARQTWGSIKAMFR